MAGSWDLFHAGHVLALARARAHGDYLVVGVYDDPLAAKAFAWEQANLRRRQQFAEEGVELPVVPCCARGTHAACGHFPVLTMMERALSVLGTSALCLLSIYTPLLAVLVSPFFF